MTQNVQGFTNGYGVVKQVLSGDSIIIRGEPKGGPPKEINIVLMHINAPKLARRPVSGAEKSTKDEPFAWEAREYLRKLLIGKKVLFSYQKGKEGNTEQKNPKQSREFGKVFNGADSTAENVSLSLVSEGLVGVKSSTRPTEYHASLLELEASAKASLKGKHSPKADQHVREVVWTIDNPAHFKDRFHQKPVKGIVEHVVDGSTLRVLLYSDEFSEYYSIKLALSGIRCSGFVGEDQKPEPFAEEAKYYTECRLLQRDVEVLLEGVCNKTTLLGTVLHPKGNIAELLLGEGFAHCVDWSIQCLTSDKEKLRLAEKSAKDKKLRLWKDYVSSELQIEPKEKEYQGKVVEVILGDTLIVKRSNGTLHKICLSSIKSPPRVQDFSSDGPDGKKNIRSRPLYDIPYMFEAREFLRKKLIGKKVNVSVDYKQPANQNYPEKTCCTVTIGGINVAEALVSKGLATVIRYRKDDDQRSAHYDELLSAETKAMKSAKGLHNKENASLRIVDLSGDPKLSRQYFPMIKRGGKMDGLVEYVVSGSRFRLYLPRQNYLLTFLLAGISCAKASREATNDPGEPYGDEALAFTKDLCLQREVQIEVDSQDKHGSFIGWMWIHNSSESYVNLSECLVQEGFAEVHSSADRSPYYRTLTMAQELAQKKKLKIWENYEPVTLEPKEEIEKRELNFKKVMVTEVKNDANELIFYAQHYDDGSKLEEMTSELRAEMASSGNLFSSFTPKKGELCAAKFSQDDEWYRGKCLKVEGKDFEILFIDYGNKEIVSSSKIAHLPTKYHSFSPFAREYTLAFIKFPKDFQDCLEEAKIIFQEETISNVGYLLNIEYKVGSLTYVTLVTCDTKEDIGKKIVERGYALVERRREKRYKKLMDEYLAAEEIAKKERSNIWVYGDITEDDAKEFG